MTERKKRFFSGPSLEAALVSAASEYGLTPEEVSYQVIEKRHGFLRIRRNVVIQVDPESPRKVADAKPRPKSETPPKSSPPPVPEPEEDEPEEDERDEDEPDGDEPDDDELDEDEPDDEGLDEDEVEAEDDRQPEPPRRGKPVLDDRPPLRPRSRGSRQGREEQDEPPAREPKPRDRGKPRDKAEAKKREPARGAKKGPASKGAASKESAPKESRRRERRQKPVEPPTPAPARPRRKRREIEPIEKRLKPAQGELADGALEATEWLLDLLDIDVDPEVYDGEERLEVELRGPDRKFLVGDNGEVLSAVEHLIPRVMRGVCGDTHPVRVDTENFQEEREDRLRELAWETGDHVRQQGQPKILEAMDPADRRIIHLALSDDPDVTTRSLGEGFFKRVKVLLK